MNLLMTADGVGGVWTYALELVRALAPHRVRVALATMGAPLRPDQRDEAARLPNLTLFESSFKLEWMDDPWEDVAQAGDWLLGLEAELRPDLVHLNGYAHGALPWAAPALVAGHSCVLSWWAAVRREAAPPRWARYQREVRRGLRAAGLVVAPSAAMLAALEEHYGPLPGARVIPNGRQDGFAPAPKQALKEALVLTAGRLWDEAKNVAVLGEVAPALPWPVFAAGEARHPQGHPARHDGVRHDGVRTLGRLSSPDLAAWLARAAIYVLPARYEPFGLSALEAALAGCALVLSDLPSLREIWGEAALFVPADDAEAWTATLNSLIRDGERRSRLARRARARALEFTPERMAEGYLDAYRGLAVQCPGGRPVRR
jgi:glycosyltransferase involved in cell wall biosynthesis